MQPRLKERFDNEIKPRLFEQFGIENVHALPRLEKIVLNVGVGRELEGGKLKPHVREQVLSDLAMVSGQKAVMIKARKSVSNFKVREGFESHAMVTLRRARMWEFFDRLITVAIPRVKDFRGLSDRSFDPAGNYSFGVSEQAIFPEINMADAQYVHGFNINIVFANSNPQRSYFVMSELGFPFRRAESEAA